ncbi:competence protein CoiA [Eupransor demetentiae]|uniref:Contains predicted nuclease domain (CoiA) n=1 Tax=Eupransor demetentiae TaxID=3109584 RepID=A0ABM9N5X7_9LACO|nr:Competence protein CoiA [Lactobacillaceae bacterium LMG 33000]
MFLAVDGGNHYVSARRAEGIKEYFCPGCRGKVILKRGLIHQAHFAHLQGADCAAFSEGESADHIAGKIFLYKLLRQYGEVTLEASLGEIGQRPDLLLQSKRGNWAIEFQCSPISAKRLAERNAGYQKLGLPVIWILGPAYLKRKLRARTILPFLYDSQLRFWQPAWSKILHRGNFLKADFRGLQFEQAFSANLFYCLRAKKSGKVNWHYQASKLEQQLLQGRLDARLVGQLYEKGCRLNQLPTWALSGQHFGLTVPNWRFRLTVLEWLEEKGLGASFSWEEFEMRFQSTFLNYEIWGSVELQELLKSLLKGGYLSYETSVFHIKGQPSWRK